MNAVLVTLLFCVAADARSDQAFLEEQAAPDTDNFDAELSVLDSIIHGAAIGEQRSRAFALRGDIWLQRNELTKALADYNSAIELEPGDSSLYLGRGNVFRELNQLDAAERDEARAIALVMVGTSGPRSKFSQNQLWGIYAVVVLVLFVVNVVLCRRRQQRAGAAASWQLLGVALFWGVVESLPFAAWNLCGRAASAWQVYAGPILATVFSVFSVGRIFRGFG